ncbi:MAG TPA: hypothetical protein PL048_02955 [Leptospiraceae bacterium]|nr:hypothetical protein [Leptospiraceae bacterium]HMY65448.1 hypothetical protein [Leptospiraceae bacterium]HMZ57706.1 hypothetical protein [Leptospiraceae bacterium]HNF14312.1 hypothetical protein [Leptospiraceae bacterium]HNH07098.1 hypothetical protein [Leptospiraceae bacterium]
MDIELYYGKSGKNDYNTIIDMFPKNSINSVRTSSLPLLAFWKETNSRLKELLNSLQIENKEKFSLCFEYPTSSGGNGKASMTDLMIFSNSKKLAIEAKFTEIGEQYELIRNWIVKGNKENRKEVLTKWIDIVKPFSQTELNIERMESIPYQFLHRTASACDKFTYAFVIYQIFFDSETEKFLQRFKEKLKQAKEIINPNQKLKFYVWPIEVKQIIEESEKENAFEKMKTENIYEFIKVNNPEQI